VKFFLFPVGVGARVMSSEVKYGCQVFCIPLPMRLKCSGVLFQAWSELIVAGTIIRCCVDWNESLAALR
jgi:hypothetical protein